MLLFSSQSLYVAVKRATSCAASSCMAERMFLSVIAPSRTLLAEFSTEIWPTSLLKSIDSSRSAADYVIYYSWSDSNAISTILVNSLRVINPVPCLPMNISPLGTIAVSKLTNWYSLCNSESSSTSIKLSKERNCSLRSCRLMWILLWWLPDPPVVKVFCHFSKKLKRSSRISSLLI